MRASALIPVLLGLLIVACGAQERTEPAGGTRADAARSGCGAQPAFVGSRRVGIGDRAVWLHVPPAAEGGRRSLPVVLAFHGVGGTGGFFARQLAISEVADREGFVVASPYALGEPSAWRVAGEEDVAFVRRTLEGLERMLCVDRERIGVVGHSNGGTFAVALGCRLGVDLTGVVAIAPGGGGPDCADFPPLLDIHGTADRVVSYGKPLPDVVQDAARDAGCDEGPRRQPSRPGTRRLRFTGCGGTVEHLRVVGGGHEIPGFAGREAWRFLDGRSPGGP